MAIAPLARAPWPERRQRREQSSALGAWFGALPEDVRPTVILASPYLRAEATARLVAAQLGHGEPLPVCVDERLREKEFGILDRLTTFGISRHHPALYEQRKHVGKFYFRPPGGESWCDVILRLRSVIDTITREHRGERLLIASHQVVVNCFRYLLERLDERTILAIDAEQDVPNCSVTSYRFDPARGDQGKLVPDLVNFVAPLTQTGTPVTTARDMPAAPKA